MKKIIFMLLAGAMLTGCVDKQEEIFDSVSQNKISFQAVKYPTSRADEAQINGTKFTYDHFVTHAWSDASVAEGNVFMDHQKVVKKSDDSGSAWMPTIDYYWPNYSTVDFISYYPENAEFPVVERETLTYTGYNVAGDKADITVATNDLMYAEKAVGYNGNADRVNDANGADTGDSGYTGVPTLFHHALAQLEIRVLVKQPEGETESHWEAVIDHAKVAGYYTKGDLTLSLKDPSLTHGVTGWTPAGEEGIGWTLSPDATKASRQLVGTGGETSTVTVSSMVKKATADGGEESVADTRGTTIFNAFVLPQALTDNHFFELKYTLNKYRGETKETSEADTEIRHIHLKTDEITYWGMNQRIVYTIIIAPGQKMRFDPAVVDWQDVSPDKSAEDYEEYVSFNIPTDWAASNVWYAMKDGQKIAEIAKEAVFTFGPHPSSYYPGRNKPDKYYQVVTVYPVKGGVTDLSNGVIAQVLKAEDGSDVANMAGGKIAMQYPVDDDSYNGWGCNAIKAIDIEGGLANQVRVFMDKKGNFTFEEPDILYTELDTEACTVSDIDGHAYPVVKIGATYWTRENLRVTQYNDGTQLSMKHESVSFKGGLECVYFVEKAPMYSWFSNETYNVEEESDDVKERYGLLYNHRAICGDDDPWVSPDLFLPQKGDTFLLKQEETNLQLAPEGWHIPTINYSPQFRPGNADVDYIDEFCDGDWGRMMTNNIATGDKRDMATAQWPAHPAASFSNITDLSLDATPALGQTDADAFDPTAPGNSGPDKLLGLVFFWTTSLIKEYAPGQKDNIYCYPGYVPCTSYKQDNIELIFQVSSHNPGDDTYNTMLAHQYLPVRCVRN